MQLSPVFYEHMHATLPGMFFKCRAAPQRMLIETTVGCEELTGYNAEALLHDKEVSFMSLVHESDQQRFSRLCRQALESRQSCNIEYRIVTATGKEKWVHEIASGIYDTEGKLLYVEGYMTDITVRKEAEATEETLRAYQDAVNQGSLVSIADRRGRIVYANEMFCTVSGYAQHELIGKNHRIVNSGHHPPEYFETLWKTIEQGLPWRGQVCNRTKGGRLYWVDSVITPVFDRKGRISQYLSVRNLITDQVEGEQFKKSVFAAIAANIAVITMEGEIVFVNDKWRIFAEVNGGELPVNAGEGTNYLEVCRQSATSGDALAQQALDGIMGVLTGAQRYFEMEYPCHSPEVQRWFMMRVSPFDGHAGRAVIVHDDITGLKMAQTALLELNSNLEGTVHERTRELNQLNRDLTDSIYYAKRIQESLFSDPSMLNDMFTESFILSRPRDIVGGDYCWFYQKGELMMLACVDSTGHGVPGAFMSIIGLQLLSSTVVGLGRHEPSEVLHGVDEGICNLLRSNHHDVVRDGMDIAFCTVNTVEQRLHFAGAHHPIVLVSGGRASLIKGSRFALGSYLPTDQKRFDTQTVEYAKGDMLYLFTDGYRDQFGGPGNKRLGMKGMLMLLESLSGLPLSAQKKELEGHFDRWRGDVEQVDDMLVMGIQL